MSEQDSAASGIVDLAKGFTSPAKLAFAAYVLLAALGKITTSLGQFILAAFLFFVVQVFHDDYLRIVLNSAAGNGRRTAR